MVAVPEALEHRHPLPAENADVAGLGARLEVELLGAFEGVDHDLRPDRGLDDRQVDLREDVVPLTHEALVRPDVHMDVSVAVAAAERAGMAFARDPDPLAVVDPGRDLDVELARVASSGRRRCIPRTRCSTVRPLPLQSGQALWRMNSPRIPRETCWSTPWPPQRRQVTGAVPGAAPLP